MTGPREGAVGRGELPPLRQVIARHRLSARKGLGQHFLLDQNLTRRIARAAGDLAGVTVLEVGPGPGGLTRALLAEGAAHVVAIERDPRCVAALAELAEAFPGRLQVVEGDALAIDEGELLAGPCRLVANLPYNVATALLVKWLAAPARFQAYVLMFQKEVAERLVAGPGGKTYGRLSVMTQWACTVEALFDVHPRAFTPPPAVTSTVVRLRPRPAPLAPADRDQLARLVAAAFGQRRKMLRTSLKAAHPSPERLLAAAGIDPTARAEQLTIVQFCALARAADGGGQDR